MHFYPYVMDCLGAIDGTHIRVTIPEEDQSTFRNRKGFLSQNVMAACSFDLKFQYILAGWEGSVHDGKLRDLLFLTGGITLWMQGMHRANISLHHIEVFDTICGNGIGFKTGMYCAL